MRDPSDPLRRIPLDIPELAVDDELPDFVIKLRMRAFASQTEAARHAGINRTTIGRYEKVDGSRPHIGYLAWLAQMIRARIPDEHQAAASEHQVLREMNRAVQRFYRYEHQPFRTWTDLRRAAEQWIDGKKSPGNTRRTSPPPSARSPSQRLQLVLPSDSSTPQPFVLYGMAYIPAGPFLQGSTPEDLAYFGILCAEANANCFSDFFDDELPQREVTLSAFFIDVHPVTNEHFDAFVTATGYRTTAEEQGASRVWDKTSGRFIVTPGADWRHPEGLPTSIAPRLRHPVVHVSYEDALAYAAWQDVRLPTEAEWEKAARGPHGFRFPWGNHWEPERLHYFHAGSLVGAVEVGRYPQGASVYGVQDMLGNVSEWVADFYDRDYYHWAPSYNPKGPASHPTNQHVRRGGSWATKAGYLHSAWRMDRPDQTSNTLGFRCARNP